MSDSYFSLLKQEEIQSVKLDAEFGQCNTCCAHSIMHMLWFESVFDLACLENIKKTQNNKGDRNGSQNNVGFLSIANSRR